MIQDSFETFSDFISIDEIGLCTPPDPNLCTAYLINNETASSIQWSGLICGTSTPTGGTIAGFSSANTGCIIDGTFGYTGAPTISITGIC